MLQVTINRSSKTAVYMQIFQQIKQQILDNEIPEGYRLLSERDFANSLGINRSTVVNAYKELESEGYVESKVGRGTIVRELNPSTVRKFSDTPYDPFNWKDTMQGISPGELYGKLTTDEQILTRIRKLVKDRDVISFVKDISPKQNNMPKLLMESLTRVAATKTEQVFQRGPVEGIAPLRECIVKIMRKRNVSVTQDQILITRSSPHALDLVARLLIKSNDTVITDEPTFMSFIRIFSRHEARVATLPMLNNNTNYCEQFSEVLRRNYAKFFMIRPTYLNPTGRTLDYETRKAILYNSYKSKVPLVEYDPYYSLYHERTAPDPILSMDSKDYVIYIGSFPRSLPLDMQLGWIVGPKTVISKIARIKRMNRDYTNSINQWIADDFCRTGNMEKYLVDVRKQCRQNCKAFFDTIQKYGQGLITGISPQGGYHVWCALPESVNAEQLLAAANYHKVVFMPGDMFFLSGNLGENHIRVTLFDITEAEVIEGTKRLCKAVQEVVAF